MNTYAFSYVESQREKDLQRRLARLLSLAVIGGNGAMWLIFFYWFWASA